jgi:TRAP-type C4-dicarboxylate transport system permease small subunit
MVFKEIVMKYLGYAVSIIMALLVVNVVLQVLVRFLGISLPFTEELAGFLLIWVSLLGASYATGKRMHLAIDLLPRKSTPVRQQQLNVLINLVVIFFALIVMVVGGSNYVYIAFTLQQKSPVLELPVGYVYLIAPLSGLLIIFFSLFNMRENPYTLTDKA